MDNLLIFIIVIPFVLAFFILVARPPIKVTGILAFLGVIICVFLTLFSSFKTQAIGSWCAPIGINLKMDGINYLFLISTIFIWGVCLLYIYGDNRYSRGFYVVFLSLFGGMFGVVLTEDIFNMFVFFEIVSLCTFILIAYKGEPIALGASVKFLLISGLGISFFLLGIGLMYKTFGVLSLGSIAERIGEVDKKILLVAFSMIVVGVGLRAAFVPLHLWLPDAHAYAPHPVSAVLSGIMIKASFIPVWRIINIYNHSDIYNLFIWVGAVGACFGVVKALSQDDIKRLIAYHSVSQMGFIIASCGVNTPFSRIACVSYIINHSLFKSLLFLSAGAVIYSTGKRTLSGLTGLWQKMPIIGLATFTGAFSISGVPFFNGYASKLYVMHALKDYTIPYWLIFLAGIGTIASFLKIVYIFGRNNKEITVNPVPIFMKLSLVLLSISCIAVGVMPAGFFRFVSFYLGIKNIGIPVAYSLNEISAFLVSLVIGIFIFLGLRYTRIGGRFISVFRRDSGFQYVLLYIVISILFIQMLFFRWT